MKRCGSLALLFSACHGIQAGKPSSPATVDPRAVAANAAGAAPASPAAPPTARSTRTESTDADFDPSAPSLPRKLVALTFTPEADARARLPALFETNGWAIDAERVLRAKLASNNLSHPSNIVVGFELDRAPTATWGPPLIRAVDGKCYAFWFNPAARVRADARLPALPDEAGQCHGEPPSRVVLQPYYSAQEFFSPSSAIWGFETQGRLLGMSWLDVRKRYGADDRLLLPPLEDAISPTQLDLTFTDGVLVEYTIGSAHSQDATLLSRLSELCESKWGKAVRTNAPGSIFHGDAEIVVSPGLTKIEVRQMGACEQPSVEARRRADKSFAERWLAERAAGKPLPHRLLAQTPAGAVCWLETSAGADCQREYHLLRRSLDACAHEQFEEERLGVTCCAAAKGCERTVEDVMFALLDAASSGSATRVQALLKSTPIRLQLEDGEPIHVNAKEASRLLAALPKWRADLYQLSCTSSLEEPPSCTYIANGVSFQLYWDKATLLLDGVERHTMF